MDLGLLSDNNGREKDSVSEDLSNKKESPKDVMPITCLVCQLLLVVVVEQLTYTRRPTNLKRNIVPPQDLKDESTLP